MDDVHDALVNVDDDDGDDDDDDSTRGTDSVEG